MTQCLSPAEFVEYIASDDEVHHPHVAQCARCRAIADILACAAPIDTLDVVLVEIDRRMQAATEAARELEARLPHRWEATAIADHRLHSPEGVRVLLLCAAKNYGSTPRRSLALARLAVACSELGRVSPDVQFDALKDYAKFALRAADDLTTAFDALDRAAELVSYTANPTYYAAVLAHSRAYIYGDSACARWDEALALLDGCEEVLKEREPQRWRAARQLRAAVLVRCGRYDEATSLYEELLESQANAYSRALLKSDLAECYLRTGHFFGALALVDDVVDVFRSRSQTISVARAMWIRGSALSGVGQHDEAITTLEAVSAIFASAGLIDDQLATELALICAMRNRDVDVDVVARLEDAYMLASALDLAQPLRSGSFRTAVWVELRDAHERKALSREVLAHAAEYLRTIARGNEAPFTGLQ